MTAIAKQEIMAIKACLSVGIDKPTINHDAELTAWRRNMLGKPFRLFKNGQFVRRFKALDLEDALSLCKEIPEPDVVGEYAYQFPYELMEVL